MKPLVHTLLLAALAVSPAGAAVVTLNAGGDGSGSSSFNTAGKWSDAAIPSAANDYEVGVQWLRSPVSGSSTFGGNSLKIKTGGAILSKNAGAQTLTVGNLILDGGFIRSGAASTDTLTLAGGIAVTSTGAGIFPDQSPFIINSTVSGASGVLTVANDASVGGYGAASGPGRGITFNGTNTFTGNLRADAGAMVFSNTSSWSFLVGASTVSNSIYGTGTINLAGAFSFDLTAAGTTLGDNWNLVNNGTLNETYASTFTVSGFTDAGGDQWTKAIDAGKGYLFEESTGTLSVVAIPEPGAALLGAIGLLGLLRRRR